jgi:hypothetical protein
MEGVKNKVQEEMVVGDTVVEGNELSHPRSV